MKAPQFEYARPDTLEAALALLNDADIDAAPLAGGQSLMPMMNFRMAAPDLLVDLNRIPGLSGVSDAGDHLRIGAMTRYASLETDPLIAAHVPLFGMGLPHIAHAAIRNRGTIGGSVSLADPAAEMPALLLALEATIEVQGPSGARKIPADDFFVGMYETAVDPGELVTAILVPKAQPEDRFGFYELARRHGDYAIAGVAIAARGTPQITASRIAFFSVTDKAVRSGLAEAALSGAEPGSVEVPELTDIEFTGDLNGSPETKAHLTRVVLTRALEGL